MLTTTTDELSATRPRSRWLRALHWLADRCVRRGAVRWIHLQGALYLERYYLLGGPKKPGQWFNVYLHRFHTPDDDRGVHNHPWEWSFSIILAGGYEEQRFEHGVWGGAFVTNTYRPGDLNAIRSDTDFHRVSKLLPGAGGEVWTLFVTGPKHGRSWGYLIDWLFVPKKHEGGCNACPHGAHRCERFDYERNENL